MNIRKTIFYLAIALLLFSCKNKKESISPEIKDISESVYASGIVKSKNQYEVFSKTNGILETIFIKEGMQIKKGDPLFKIENKNAKFNTDNARLSSNANDYLQNPAKLNDSKNAIQLAKKKLANDSLMLLRQKNLWEKNIGSKIELEQKQLNYENAKAAFAHAKASDDDLKRQLKLISDQSKNNLQIAESSESDLIIRSNVDGIVYKINKEKGELVTSLSAIAIIGQNEFIIELNIDEFDIVKMKIGQQVIVRMDSYKSQVFDATVSSIYPIMNERTRTFKAEAVFVKAPEKLFPNLTMEANIVIDIKKNALTIPRNYLVNDSTVILENGKPQIIKTGLMDYNLVEILSGIVSGSKIILPER